MNDEPRRQAHAPLDLASRLQKGRKIEALIGVAGAAAPVRMLEIGTGSGGIAHYFGCHADIRYDVVSVDVVDLRVVTDGYEFIPVTGVRLPFADESFDFVLTNHVIEHVGDAGCQREHLCEVRRVLKPDGVVYLSVPNRWMLVEPHYRLPFLSWLPRAWRSPYLRLTGKGTYYDCEPLSLGQLETLLRSTDFAFSNICIPALHRTLEIEARGSWLQRAMLCMPQAVLAAFKPVIPTLIYLLHKHERIPPERRREA